MRGRGLSTVPILRRSSFRCVRYAHIYVAIVAWAKGSPLYKRFTTAGAVLQTRGRLGHVFILTEMINMQQNLHEEGRTSITGVVD